MYSIITVAIKIKYVNNMFLHNILSLSIFFQNNNLMIYVLGIIYYTYYLFLKI